MKSNPPKTLIFLWFPLKHPQKRVPKRNPKALVFLSFPVTFPFKPPQQRVLSPKTGGRSWQLRTTAKTGSDSKEIQHLIADAGLAMESLDSALDPNPIAVDLGNSTWVASFFHPFLFRSKWRGCFALSINSGQLERSGVLVGRFVWI